jgi:predicted thioesterase
MKEIFKKGDKKFHNFEVTDKDLAHFEKQAVHDVCATFTLAREIEWACRLFVLDMLEEGEEGIGTSLNIQHLSPAFLGEKVEIEAGFLGIENREIICGFEVRVDKRLVATGTTGQKIILKKKLVRFFAKLSQ